MQSALMHRFAGGTGAGDLMWDVCGLGSPVIGLGIFIVAGDIVTDDHDELLEVVKHAARMQFSVRTEEALDHVQP